MYFIVHNSKLIFFRNVKVNEFFFFVRNFSIQEANFEPLIFFFHIYVCIILFLSFFLFFGLIL